MNISVQWLRDRGACAMILDNNVRPKGRRKDHMTHAQTSATGLLVRCPSTDRPYVLRVPQKHRTARSARVWSLHDPEVET
jgi:hypothetical protein